MNVSVLIDGTTIVGVFEQEWDARVRRTHGCSSFADIITQELISSPERHSVLRDAIRQIDDGGMMKIVESLSVSDSCLLCKSFDKSQNSQYRCAVMGRCIGITLSEEMKSYILTNVVDDGEEKSKD